jgi:hypothetical protein
MAGRVISLSLVASDRMSRTFKSGQRSVDRFGATVEKHNKTFKTFGNTATKALNGVEKALFGPIDKMFNVATAASVAAGGLSAVGAASTALAASVGPATGALAVYPGVLAAIKQGALVARLGLLGMDKALDGDAKAMAALSPNARAVAEEIVRLKKPFDGLRKFTQQRLFAGIAPDLRVLAEAYLPMLRQAAGRTAGQLNALARAATTMALSPTWKSDFGTITKTNAQVIGLLGRAALNLAPAVRDIWVAALPLVVTFARWAKSATAVVASQVAQARASGALARFFKLAGQTAAQLGRIVAQLGMGVFNAFKIGYSSGRTFLDVLERAATRFNEWTESVRGRSVIAAWFQQGNDTLAAFGRLVRDAAAGLKTGFAGTSLAPLIDQIRVQLLPSVIELFNKMSQTDTLTPLIGAAAKLAEVLTAALGSGGGLAAFAQTLELLATGAAAVVSNVPGAATALGLLFAAAGARKAAMLFGLPGLLRGVATAAGGLRTAAVASAVATAGFATGFANVNAAMAANATVATRLGAALRSQIMLWRQMAAAQGVSTARIIAVAAAQRIAAAASRAWAIATWALNIAMRANPITLIITALIALAAATVIAYRNSERFRGIVQAVWNAVRAAVMVAWSGIRPVFTAIATVLRAVLGRAFIVFANTAKIAWILTQVAVKVAWAVIKPIFNALRSYLGGPLSAAFRAARSVISAVWKAVQSTISSGYNSGIRPVFDRLKTAVGAVRNAFKTAVDAIGRIWGGLKELARKPVNFIIGLYNAGIVRLVNKLAEFVKVPTRLKEIPKFATGGVMPGYAPGRDSLIAAVSPGESIFRPEFTKAVGGRFVEQANAVARSGGPQAVRGWLSGPDALGGEGIGFARGGVVPRFAGSYGFGGIVGGFIDGIKNFAIGNVAKAARGLLGKIFSGGIPGGGIIKDLIAALPKWITDNLVKWITAKASLGGGPGMQRALAWAKTQHGLPYEWATRDCSWFMSSIESVIRGQRPHRRWATGSFQGGGAPPGWQRNARSGFMIGVTHADVGHTAGTLLGKNVESSGSAGVRVGGGARGASHPMFSHRYGLRADSGALTLRPGWNPPTFNGTGRPELLETPPGGGQPIVIPIYLDGKQIAEVTFDHTKEIVRKRGGKGSGSAQRAWGYS